MNTAQFEKVRNGRGFFAALDQSGGSTPKALKMYGVDESAYSDDDEMMDVMHADVGAEPAQDTRQIVVR